MVYHSVDKNGNYHKFELPMFQYVGYEDLKARALKAVENDITFDDLLKNIPQENLIFDN